VWLGSRFLFLPSPATLRLASLAQCKPLSEWSEFFCWRVEVHGACLSALIDLCGLFISFFVKTEACIRVIPAMFKGAFLITKMGKADTTQDPTNPWNWFIQNNYWPNPRL